MYKCHNCSKSLEELDDIRGKVGRQDVCSHCYADLHCCMNCRFHEPGCPNECRETSTAFVRERNTQNFCAAFEFKHAEEGDGGEEVDAKSKLNSLFKF